MQRVMLDLETMGTQPGSAIISIGAVFFGEECQWSTGNEFHAKICLEDAVKCGLKMSASTVKWWLDQSKEAQSAVMQPGSRLIPVLMEFSEFLTRNGNNVELWGNGADFDNVLLSEAYYAVGLPVPWKFYLNKCFRTLKGLPRVPGAPARDSLKHDALEDAKHQARHANLILQHLNASA